MWEDKAFLSSLFGGALGGAMITALANTAINRLSLRNFDLSARTDDLCRDVERLGDIGVRYWVSSAEVLGVEGLRLRAEIHGLQRRIELWLDLLGHDSWLFSFDAGHDLVELFTAVSGGDFAEPDRAADLDRCQDIQRRAAGLVVAIRRSRRHLLRGFF
jgi:hypothetical protein